MLKDRSEDEKDRKQLLPMSLKQKFHWCDNLKYIQESGDVYLLHFLVKGIYFNFIIIIFIKLFYIIQLPWNLPKLDAVVLYMNNDFLEIRKYPVRST